jgi:hypothetical protein
MAIPTLSYSSPLWTAAPFQLHILKELKLKLYYDGRSVGQSILVSSNHLGLTARFLLLSHSCGFVDVGRSFWRENECGFYNCCWSSPTQWFLSPSRAGLVTIFYCLRFETPQPGRQGPRIYIPQKQGSPVISPDTEFQFHRLLRLAGIRWRYSNPPPRGVAYSCSSCAPYNRSVRTTVESSAFKSSTIVTHGFLPRVDRCLRSLITNKCYFRAVP